MPPFAPYIEETVTKVTGSFTGSLVNTKEFDKYRQGVEHRGLGALEIDRQTVVLQPYKLEDGSSIFPQDKFPKAAFLDAEQDASEPYGFWHEGFLEPLTIRDEVAFTSIESPFIVHTPKADMPDSELVEQEVLKNDRVDIKNQQTFIESGSVVSISVTSSIFGYKSTGSIVSIRVDDDPNLDKISAAAGYDFSQIIITGSQLSPGIRPIYRDKDSLAYRDRAPYQARGIFLESDSAHVNLSGTRYSFENGINANKEGAAVPNQHSVYVTGVKGRYVTSDIVLNYPPISRLDTNYKGVRNITFIDDAPSGSFSTYIRQGMRTGQAFQSTEKPPSIHENNNKNSRAFSDIILLTGSRDSKTGEMANVLLTFDLKERSGKYILVSTDYRSIDVTPPSQDLANLVSGEESQCKALVYDFQGSNETTQTLIGIRAPRSMTGSGWFEVGGFGVAGGTPSANPLPQFLHAAYNKKSATESGVALLSDNIRASGVESFNSNKMFMQERGYKFNFPFVIKKVALQAEILAANSAAFINQSSIPQTQATRNQVANWTFRPLGGTSTLAGLGTNISELYLTESANVFVSQTSQIPHAVFAIVKSFQSPEQQRGRTDNFANAATTHDRWRYPVGLAINADKAVITQIIFSASIGLTGSGTGIAEQAYYPKLDYYIGSGLDVIYNPQTYTGTNAEIAAKYLSGSKDTRAYYLTESIRIVKDPVVNFSITRSLDDDAKLNADYAVLSSQKNFINKNDTIHFVLPGAPLFFASSVNTNAIGTSFTHPLRIGWASIFAIRDVRVVMEGYIPRAGEAIPDSLNQNLTSDAIHEDIHEIIHDEFETFFSSAYTGSMLSRFAHPSNWHQGNIDFALHAYKIFDSAEVYNDSGLFVLTASGEFGLKKNDRFFPTEKLTPKNKLFAMNSLSNKAIEGSLNLIGDYEQLRRTHRIGGIRDKRADGVGKFITGSETGFRYGLMSTQSMHSNAIFRYNRFGQFRDMLEQRQYARFIGVRRKEDSDAGIVVDTAVIFMSSSTKDLNWSQFVTASAPYQDAGPISVRYAGTQILRPEGAPYKLSSSNDDTTTSTPDPVW